jgi:hypothetical protein
MLRLIFNFLFFFELGKTIENVYNVELSNDTFWKIRYRYLSILAKSIPIPIYHFFVDTDIRQYNQGRYFNKISNIIAGFSIGNFHMNDKVGKYQQCKWNHPLCRSFITINK